MEDDLTQIQSSMGQRRPHAMMLEQISNKLSSKGDWYKFLEQNL